MNDRFSRNLTIAHSTPKILPQLQQSNAAMAENVNQSSMRTMTQAMSYTEYKGQGLNPFQTQLKENLLRQSSDAEAVEECISEEFGYMGKEVQLRFNIKQSKGTTTEYIESVTKLKEIMAENQDNIDILMDNQEKIADYLKQLEEYYNAQNAPK